MRGVGALVMVLLVCAVAGCRAPASGVWQQNGPVATQPSPPADGLSRPQYVDVVRADCVPPSGWGSQPLKADAHHTHQLWLSPSGRTAYGVIHFTLPFPVGHDLVLWAFLNEMRHGEGSAVLLNRQWDSNLDGIRFVAEGGLYTVRTNLLLRGFDGWAIYAGTNTHQDIVQQELALAERARERTRVGTAACAGH